MTTITSLMRLELGGTRDYVNQGGLSRSAIFNQTEASLKRLNTDYIDVLLIHMSDLETPLRKPCVLFMTLSVLERSGTLVLPMFVHSSSLK